MVSAVREVSTHPLDEETRRAWSVAAGVVDPEIPVLTIDDLGVLRAVEVAANDRSVRVTITPTYSGCPAMDAIRDDLMLALTAAGFAEVRVDLVLAPAWSTDWMSVDGREKLRRFGIAPPSGRAPVRGAGPVRVALAVKCPRCGSLRTHEISRFGSTSCKALFECLDCLEPFDSFKVL
jgi:ring-1,2-phenylacetyl-CoA epoxidase subunit PaaD